MILGFVFSIWPVEDIKDLIGGDCDNSDATLKDDNELD